MKAQLEKIYHKKKKLISSIKKARNEYISTVYDGLIKRKSIQEIHRDIRKVSKVIGESNYFKPIERYSMDLANKMIKKVDNDIEVSLLADVVFKLFNRQQVFTETNTLAFEEAKRYESDDKIELLNKAIRNGERLGQVFYLISKHRDSAKDHIDYQGRIYIDENWRNAIHNDEAIKDIERYIRENNTKTFQWVTNAPVYMITRPNCRHYFKRLRTEDVLKYDTTTLLRKNKMTHWLGKRETQTFKKNGHTKEEILDYIRKYEERIEYHKALLKKNKNSQILKHSIAKDRYLIAKWKEYLSRM